MKDNQEIEVRKKKVIVEKKRTAATKEDKR